MLKQRVQEENNINDIIESAKIPQSENLTDLKVYIIELTPKIAQSLLENNFQGQRKLSLTKYKKYSNEIKTGNWRFNGEAISLDENQRLINGQHRCMAVIEAGVSIPVLIITGLQNESFKTMDQGWNRGTAQIMQMMGIKYSALLASGIKYINEYELRGTVKGGGSTHSSALTTEKIYNRDKDHFNWCAEVVTKTTPHTKGTGFTPSIFFFIASFCASQEDKNLFSQFIDDFSHQNWTSREGCPVKFLRVNIERCRERKHTVTERANAIASAWNNYKQEKPMSVNYRGWKKQDLIKIK